MKHGAKLKWLRVGIMISLLGWITNISSSPTQLIDKLTFDTLNGTAISLQSLQGKTVLIMFWATSCPVCLEEMPDFIRIYKQFHQQGLEIIAVSMSYDSLQAVNQYQKKMSLPFPVVLDSNNHIAHAFGDITLTPTVFLLDSSGQPVSKTIGFLNFELLEKYLKKQLNKENQ